MPIKNFNQEIKNLDNEIIKDGLEDKSLTIKKVVVSSLQTQIKGDDALSVQQILKNVALAEKINSSEGDTKIESEEIITIKERVAKSWQPIILYRVNQFLEN